MRTITTTVTALATSLAVAGSAGAQTPELDWADRLVDDLPTPSALNSYGSPAKVEWAGVGGATVSMNRTKCAPFLTRLLKQGRGWTDSQLSSWFGSSSPTSERYHAAIEAGSARCASAARSARSPRAT